MTISLPAIQQKQQVEPLEIKQHSDKIVLLLERTWKQVLWNILGYIFDQLIEHEEHEDVLVAAEDRYHLHNITVEILRGAWSERRSSDENVTQFRNR